MALPIRTSKSLLSHFLLFSTYPGKPVAYLVVFFFFVVVFLTFTSDFVAFFVFEFCSDNNICCQIIQLEKLWVGKSTYKFSTFFTFNKGEISKLLKLKQVHCTFIYSHTNAINVLLSYKIM